MTHRTCYCDVHSITLVTKVLGTCYEVTAAWTSATITYPEHKKTAYSTMVTICHSNWHGSALSDLWAFIYAGHSPVPCAGLFLTKISDEETNIDALHVAETVTRGWLSSALGLAVCRSVIAALKILLSYEEIPHRYIISHVSAISQALEKLTRLVYNQRHVRSHFSAHCFIFSPASHSILSALSCPDVPPSPFVHAGWPGGQISSKHTVQAGRVSLCVRSSPSTLFSLSCLLNIHLHPRSLLNIQPFSYLPLMNRVTLNIVILPL